MKTIEWGFLIILYLFLGGLSAGLFFVSAVASFLQNGDARYQRIARWGALLAFVYALGLGVPFLLVSFGFQVAMRASAFFRRRARLVTRIGGVMLVCVGLLEVTGAWSTFMAWLQVHWVSSYQPPI